MYLPGTAKAGALYFYEMSSASESSYAGAGMVARANDAGTAFSNPAGMTRFDSPTMLAGATGVYINAGFTSGADTTIDGTEKGVNKRVVPAGSFAYVHPMSDKLSLGVSLHNYFGLAIDWKDDWVGRESAVNVALLAPQLHPAVAYLAVPTRPPADKRVRPTSEEALARAYTMFQASCDRVELLVGYEGDAFASTGDVQEDLLSITAVHPMREAAVRKMIARAGGQWDLVTELVREQRLIEVQHGAHRYYLRPVRQPGRKSEGE